MKKTRLNRAEEVAAGDFPPVTREQDAEDWQAVLNELLEIAEKLPADDTKKTLKETLADFQKPKTTIIQRHDGKTISVRNGVVRILNPSEPTKIDAESATKEIHSDDDTETGFTPEELELLEKLKNA